MLLFCSFALVEDSHQTHQNIVTCCAKQYQILCCNVPECPRERKDKMQVTNQSNSDPAKRFAIWIG